MGDAKELGITPASAGTGTGGSVSLGKGAWDCDANREIPPEKEARPPARAARGAPACPRSWAAARGCPRRRLVCAAHAAGSGLTAAPLRRASARARGRRRCLRR